MRSGGEKIQHLVTSLMRFERRAATPFRVSVVS
jgi:hypothetical protein